MIEEATIYIQNNIHLAPFLIFSLLILAGFNVPVSEDGMLFISAVMAYKFPDYLIPLFLGVYLGAYLSDLICYALGYHLGPKLWKIRFFAQMVSPETVEKLNRFYTKYGVFTLIFGRFIPFGVRNGLFLTAGLGKMPFKKFALADLLACTISCSFFFTLYYKLGDSVIETIKKGNMVVFGIAVAFILTILVLKKVKSKKSSL